MLITRSASQKRQSSHGNYWNTRSLKKKMPGLFWTSTSQILVLKYPKVKTAGGNCRNKGQVKCEGAGATSC